MSTLLVHFWTGHVRRISTMLVWQTRTRWYGPCPFQTAYLGGHVRLTLAVLMLSLLWAAPAAANHWPEDQQDWNKHSRRTHLTRRAPNFSTHRRTGWDRRPSGASQWDHRPSGASRW